MEYVSYATISHVYVLDRWHEQCPGAILFALRLLDGDPEYVCYVIEYSGLCEIVAERLALFFAKLPENTGGSTISDNGRVVPARAPRRRIHVSVSNMITNSLMVTRGGINAVFVHCWIIR
ncbi:predicted protein [Lichtheimia corymbifera JMRC:FSU:9682]|uniref:Uncharacterized protein n=1 Tax=Lichtheimia corymbifera JMRC:FSU:9682 TaxID=1263082 RepID=A0A068S8K8_9FUNG|nr:predicted protein [Lichtheimia corymbifera JMRC:FSU:9682]